MATNVFKGRHGDLLHAATSSGTLVAFGHIRNFSMTVSADVINATSFDSSDWREVLPGERQWSFTAETLMVSTNATAEHATLRSYLTTETRRWFAVANDAVGSTGYHWQGYGYVTDWDVQGPENEVQLQNFTITGDGAYVESST